MALAAVDSSTTEAAHRKVKARLALGPRQSRGSAAQKLSKNSW